MLVADSSKLGQAHLGRVAGLDEIDELITDTNADEGDATALREAGLRVRAVSPRRR